jgi:hypothetical protein
VLLRLRDEYHGIDAEAPEEVVNSSLATVKIMGGQTWTT